MPPTHEPAAGTRRVRLADVATLAGVTKSTASRVLNGDASLSIRPATRERVHQAAVELGYRAHSGARSLALNETRVLALLIPDLTNPTYSRIVRGAYRRARERGYVVLIAEAPTDEDAAAGSGLEVTATDLVEAHRVDGLLVASARPGDAVVELLTRRRVPHVFVNRTVPGSGRNVTMDVAGASRVAIEHLTGLGHRRVGHLAGPAGIVPAAERERAFVEACTALGLTDPPVRREEFSPQGGYRGTLALLDRHPDLTALYVSTFAQAVGTLRALQDQGLVVPRDVSVVAFDDVPEADFLTPPLTTVAMPLTELGATAVDALVDQLEGRPPSDMVLRPTPRLVPRRSSAPPRSAP